MAKKDGATRLADTISFMKANGARSLAKKIETVLNTDQRKTDAGDAIQMDYWIKTDSDRARQAIMLCRYVFVEKKLLGEITPWGEAAMDSKQKMQNHWRHKSKASIMEGVKAYDRLRHPTCMAAALEGLGRNPSQADLHYYNLVRTQTSIGTKAAICYQTVTLAMFMAGHVSVPWLASWYSASNAANCFDLMGNGTEVPNITAVSNLRGKIISFRNRTKMGAQYVNHWAVIIGNGRAIGSNTDGFDPAGSTTVGTRKFIWGDRNFQEFDLADCYAACSENTKYRDAGGVRIAIHDPSTMTLW
ncbi:hypothetical protein [Marivita sp. XM-24bin2]|jgi:hypothetical protein|uniref:hypothetical protein n=1 Tax=unclassified Marivita TaxID=2632480 RepID=UPI000D7A0DFA|nr:hypothetical protein [Marivita sp. XM-24bin2]MCR9107297.1 hypothetical protein [Paracoccaceae bacterium]PWL36577.1 MAG: hypothetical protein DCO97_03620 [Marivita sp. XM-24bin2]